MSTEIDMKSEAELAIEEKLKESVDTAKSKKQLLIEAQELKKKLEKEAKETSKKIRRLQNESKKADSYVNRNKDYRLKAHAGGMLEMTGLLRYVYPEGYDSDNPQDRLIANLLVGSFQKLAYDLETMPIEELQELWGLGQKFRNEYKKDRELPKVNPNILELIKSVKDRIKLTSATNQQPSDNVQSDKAVV